MSEVAQANGLKIVGGRVRLPDLRIEYETREGERTRGVTFNAKNSRPTKDPPGGSSRLRWNQSSWGPPLLGSACAMAKLRVFRTYVQTCFLRTVHRNESGPAWSS